MKIQKIAQWLREHISLNKSRAKCLMMMMKGMITLRTVNLSRLIPSFDASVKGASHERRMSRFLKEIQINPLEILRMIAVFLRLKKINKVGLIVDRTNWKRGEKYLNFLFIALKTKNWTIPVWVLPICEQKQGNHRLTQIESALDAILQIIPAEKIDYFLGDAEFGYLSRIELFQERGISLYSSTQRGKDLFPNYVFCSLGSSKINSESSCTFYVHCGSLFIFSCPENKIRSFERSLMEFGFSGRR